jgi:hypothetical protein
MNRNDTQKGPFHRRMARLLPQSREVNLSGRRAIPTESKDGLPNVLKELRTACGMQYVRTDEVARNGALLENNFGQRFSWAPLAFSPELPSPPQFFPPRHVDLKELTQKELT